MATKTADPFTVDQRLAAVRRERADAEARYTQASAQLRRIHARLNYETQRVPGEPDAFLEHTTQIEQLRADLARAEHERIEAAEILAAATRADVVALERAEWSRGREFYTPQWSAAVARLDAALEEAANAAVALRALGDQTRAAAQEIRGFPESTAWGMEPLGGTVGFWLTAQHPSPGGRLLWRREMVRRGFLKP